ncbi:hypothetical protein Dsin_021986 [Dipteronia sinensis]|uniref:Uncharacterized protein n=1 Tax=Dipteronia sinensis TaxID=43782 RepID=A0AAE0A202_9ROSI|nr:hypothetical protein Dsin_021986 [Dipteronia sinensis]
MLWCGVCGLLTIGRFWTDKPVDFLFALSIVWRAVHDTDCLSLGCMRNSMDDLLIFRHFGPRGCPPRAPLINSVVWSPPSPGWVKVNMDVATFGSPGTGGCGGVFRNCRLFVKDCFATLLGFVFAFETELLSVSMAINYDWIND